MDYILLHGGGQASWVWDDTIAALGVQTDGGYGRALALDVPGCGTRRDQRDDLSDNRAIASGLVAEIEAAGMADAVLVGHSQAGQVIPFMAEAAPHLFRRLVYVSCSIPLAGQNVHDMMGTGRHGERTDQIGWPFDRTTGDIADHAALLFCNDMTAGQTRQFLGKLGKDHWPAPTYSFSAWPDMRRASTGATYVRCLRDAILPIRWQDILADRLAVDRRVAIDAGHQAMVTRPHALAEILRHESSLAIDDIRNSGTNRPG